ncbi:hypothetical protein H257_14327 [Aphanomyces astaci]|uniref:Core-binding (CB) domain-containing protein n=1 Tax=Aphanomyces astaci TaxID=112090 RepID=W4FRR6_APHAT|nr:hypothetical protein H257_14327 [Aphanomyces astaci]ETV70162.1 hypothetical protein H257_14327 [Aphanomyces astaci]|eukprot:XP_009840393.1 hypothetical protein H257_14327 [Aphanomyces astaci]
MSATTRHDTSLQDIRGMWVPKSTIAGYRSGLNQIKKWILAHGTPDMLTSIGSIDLTVFTYDHFLLFIQWAFQNTSNKPGTLARYRLGIHAAAQSLVAMEVMMNQFERVCYETGLVMPTHPTEDDVSQHFEPVALYI